jgi:hypothetical protein
MVACYPETSISPDTGGPYSPAKPAEPAKIEPSGGLEALDQFLGRRREDEANERRLKEDNRKGTSKNSTGAVPANQIQVF